MSNIFISGFDTIFRYGQIAVGNKAYNLALLSKKVDDLNLPKSTVLLSSAKKDIATAKKELSDFVVSNIGYPLIARSSTTVEDSSDSFAGLFLSEVCRDKNELFTAIDNVLKSPLAEGVVKYCEFKQIDHKTIKVAVLIQQYINPDISGVMFTKHPLSNDTSVILIEYKENTSNAVTAGTIIPHNMVIKKNKSIPYDSLFDRLRNIALLAEDAFGYPLDIEWILSDNKVWIVQVRQITT
jgi:pyruvate,water dikinase